MLDKLLSKSGMFFSASSQTHPKLWSSEFYILKLLLRKLEYAKAKYVLKLNSPKLLDMGCAEMPYKPIFEAVVGSYIGIDIDSNQYADIHFSSDGSVPLLNNSIDIILSTQVLEHVFSPQNYLSECYRVLKPGGVMFLSTHGYWCYHPCPTDFWRWTGMGLRKIVEDAGFQLVESSGLMSLASTAAQLFQCSIDQRLPNSRFIRYCKIPFYVLMQSLAQFLDFTIPSNKEDDACVFFLVIQK